MKSLQTSLMDQCFHLVYVQTFVEGEEKVLVLMKALLKAYREILVLLKEKESISVLKCIISIL